MPTSDAIRKKITRDTNNIHTANTKDLEALHFWNRAVAHAQLAEFFLKHKKYTQAIGKMYLALSDARNSQIRYSTPEEKARCESLIEQLRTFKSLIVESKNTMKIKPAEQEALSKKRKAETHLEHSIFQLPARMRLNDSCTEVYASSDKTDSELNSTNFLAI